MAFGADWANLLSDILILIAKRLSALEYANFSAVCTSWASIASPANTMPRPLPLRKNQPFLLFSGDGNDDCEHSDFCTLFDFLDNSLYRINHLPEIRGKWLVGSQLGWLAVIDEFSNPSLLNPFTRSQIELPKITTVPEVEPIYDPAGSLTSYRFYGDEYRTLEEARPPLGIKKLVLSSNPTTDGGDVGALAIGPCGILMFTRPGESQYWNLLKPYMRHSIVDVIYRDGKFLALSNFGDVYAIDLSCPYYSPEDSLFANRYSDDCSGTRYLVDSSGDLLHVYRENDFVDCEFMYKTYKIEIRSLDRKTGVWIPVTSLGDCSLFVGSWCSMSFSAKEISWLEENRVYFTDDHWDILGSSETKKMARDIGMFNLSSGSFGTCYPSEMRLTWPPPIWITSPQI